MRTIRGKKALVTGAASGIGRALALKLAGEGADVFLVDKDEAGLAAVAAESPEIAAEALQLIDVEYELLPAILSLDEAIAPGAPVIHDETDANGKTKIKWTQPYNWAVDEKNLATDLRRLQQEFGLTPSSRSQVTIHASPDEDPVAAFVKKRGDKAGA